MTTEFTELVRDSMERFVADIRLPAGLADRARRRHRQRRFAQGTAIVAGTAVLSVVVAAVTGAAGFARTAQSGATGGSVAGHALTTAYVVRQVSDALANDNMVMRATRSASAGGHPTYCCTSPGGQLSTQYVTWVYQGRISYFLYGLHSQPQWNAGTALINGKLTQVYVEYLQRQWSLLPGNPLFPTPPASACAKSEFLSASEIDANWPSEIRSSLACGAYHVDGYADIGGVKTIKVTGSVVFNDPRGGSSNTTTLFVDPASYLPVQVTQSMTINRLPAELGSGSKTIQSSDDIQWLKPTPANIAETLVTIPAGFQETAGPGH
jgi:hypothetical protein